MNHAMNWSTVKGNFFDFLDNSISRTLHGCCSIGSKWLITLYPIKPMFLKELIQFGEDVLSSCTNFYTAQVLLDNGFVSSSANLQYRINCPSSETSIVSSRWIPNNWTFFSLSKSCFNKSSELWRYMSLALLSDSGIFLTLWTFFSSVQTVNVNFNFKTGKNYSLQLDVRMFSGHNDKSHFQESKYFIDIFYATIFSND